MRSSTGDPWEDEGFGAEDDWEGQESVEADLEDDVEDEPLEDQSADDDELDDGA